MRIFVRLRNESAVFWFLEGESSPLLSSACVNYA